MSSVEIKYTDPNEITAAVMRFVAGLRSTFPEIESVIWFGSWVSGLPSAGSDVDLCVIVSQTDLPLRDRVARFLPTRFPVGVDMVVYTADELKQLSEEHPSWYQAIEQGRRV